MVESKRQRQKEKSLDGPIEEGGHSRAVFHSLLVGFYFRMTTCQNLFCFPSD